MGTFRKGPGPRTRDRQNHGPRSCRFLECSEESTDFGVAGLPNGLVNYPNNQSVAWCKRRDLHKLTFFNEKNSFSPCNQLRVNGVFVNPLRGSSCPGVLPGGGQLSGSFRLSSVSVSSSRNPRLFPSWPMVTPHGNRPALRISLTSQTPQTSKTYSG